jgi:hypothetical protein
MLRFLPIAALGLLAGCADLLLSDTPSPEARGLALSITASAPEVSPGDTLRLVAWLTNTNPRTVQLSFASGCQIMPYIEDARGTAVEPTGGWFCTAAITHLTLEGGASLEREFLWTATARHPAPGTGRSTPEPLPAGTYRARFQLERAVMDGPGGPMVELRTPDLPLEVR